MNERAGVSEPRGSASHGEPRESAVPEAGHALAVERAIRTAARSGNRLLAAGVARIGIDAGAGSSAASIREALVTALTRMGVRCETDARVPADFIFVDSLETPADADSTTATGTGFTGPIGSLPAVTVALDGGVLSPRAADPHARIAWAAKGMRATAVLAERLRAASSARSPRIAVSLVLEPKTAALTLALADAGCEVALFSAVSETDPEVAAALAEDGRVAVFAPLATSANPEGDRGGDDVPRRTAAQIDAANAAGVLEWGPEFLIDDGSHLIRLAHTEQTGAFATLRAAAEETTSGVRPLHEMERSGALQIPVISVNDARTKTGFDNLIGTGQSCVFAIADLLDRAQWAGVGPATQDQADAHEGYRGLTGTRWVIIGYGPVGVGTARYAAALGARIAVVERDPVLSLAAMHDGFEARSLEDALPEADVVVSATGVWHTLTAADFSRMPAGAAVAVAGGIDDELALDELRELGWRIEPRAARVDEWIPPGVERGPLVLAGGGGVNYSAAEGNPIEVMDLSFATQLAALLRLLEDAPNPGVHGLTLEVESAVARAALEARGGQAAGGSSPGRPGGAAQPWTVHRYRTTSG